MALDSDLSGDLVSTILYTSAQVQCLKRVDSQQMLGSESTACSCENPAHSSQIHFGDQKSRDKALRILEPLAGPPMSANSQSQKFGVSHACAVFWVTMSDAAFVIQHLPLATRHLI